MRDDSGNIGTEVVSVPPFFFFLFSFYLSLTRLLHFIIII